MTYYLLLEGDSEKDVYFDSNVLGEESFGTFYAGQGLVALNNIVNQKPELLETIKILPKSASLVLVELGWTIAIRNMPTSAFP